MTNRRTSKNAKAATFAKAQATSEMPAMCPICCKEIVKATQTSEGQQAVLSDGTCKNGCNEDVLGFTRRIAEPYSIEHLSHFSALLAALPSTIQL